MKDSLFLNLYLLSNFFFIFFFQHLVEIFFFKTKREIIKDTSKHKYEEVDVHYKLPVFTSNGLFYTFWSEEIENKGKTKKRKKFLPHVIENM